MHSNQVTNVAFLANDQRMVTVGADDRCVVQWRVHWSQKQEQGEEWFRKARNQVYTWSRSHPLDLPRTVNVFVFVPYPILVPSTGPARIPTYHCVLSR